MAKPVADDVGNANDEPKELTLREEIEGARDAYVESVEEAQPADAAARDESASGGRQRGAGGRFVKGGDSAQTEVSNEPAGVANPVAAEGQQTAGNSQPGAVAQPGQEAPSGPLIAPNSWSAQAKAEWATLPPTIQQEVARREQEIHKTLSRHDEERSLGNQLGQIYQKESDYFSRTQVHPLKLMQDFIGISKILGGPDQNAKAQLLVQAALQNGLNVDALAVMARNMRGQPPGNASPQGQPGLSNGAPSAGLPPEVNQALTEIRQFKEQQDRQAREVEEQHNRTAEAEIVAFRSDPSHPHFDAVKDYMVALLANGQAASLKDAYEAACWARPDIRSTLIQSQDAARVASEKARNAAQNARRKGGSIAGGPGGGNGAATPDRSLRDELKANMAAALTQRA